MSTAATGGPRHPLKPLIEDETNRQQLAQRARDKQQAKEHLWLFSLAYLGRNALFPPAHLCKWYQAIDNAVHEPDTPKNQALFGPRNYGKTVSTIEVVPAWLAVRFPSIRIAIASHKKKHASKRAKSAVAAIEEVCDIYDIPVHDASKTTIQLEAGRTNIEPTLEPVSIRTNDTGSHYDVIIYDDIATLTNQTTALKPQISENFENFYDNVAAKRGATCLPHKSLNIVIGTRKTPEDVYREHILSTNEPEWDGFQARGVSQPGWQAHVWRATADWHVVENEAYEVHATDGNTYDTLRDVPDDADVVDDGIRPTDRFRTLWPAFEKPETVLTKVVSKSGSSGLWQAENQQNPEAAIGRVLELDWLRFTDPIPRDDWDQYEWYAGLDFANPNNLAAEERGERDYWALAVHAYDSDLDQGYAVDVWRDRDLMWEQAAEDFVDVHLADYPIGELLVESNFEGKEIAETIEDTVDIRVTPSSSDGDKEERLRSYANRCQQGRIKVASDQNERWESFLRDEWLPFPDGDFDRFDALEIASRGPDSTVEHVTGDDCEHLDW